MYNVSYTLLNGSRLLKDYIKSGRALWTPGNSAAIEYPTDPLKLVKDYLRLTDRGCGAPLPVNVSIPLIWLAPTVFFLLSLPPHITLGNAIVCWKARTI